VLFLYAFWYNVLKLKDYFIHRNGVIPGLSTVIVESFGSIGKPDI